jgi:hypothetical protein
MQQAATPTNSMPTMNSNSSGPVQPRKKSILPWILGGLGVVVVLFIAFIVLVMATAGNTVKEYNDFFSAFCTKINSGEDIKPMVNSKGFNDNDITQLKTYMKGCTGTSVTEVSFLSLDGKTVLSQDATIKFSTGNDKRATLQIVRDGDVYKLSFIKPLD